MAKYKRYQKLQKYYLGVPVEPAEYKEGELIGIEDYNSIEECEKDTPQITYNNWVATSSDVLVYNTGFTINSLGTHDDGYYHFTIEGAGTNLRFDYNIIYSHYIDLTNMTDLSYIYLGSTFYTGGDFSGWNTSNITTMSNLFKGSTYLKTLDLSSFNTSKVTDMSEMFDGCSSLKKLDLSSFNTSKVTTMNRMFEHCNSLKTLDLSHFDTSKVTEMSSMFNDCTSLKTLNLSSFDTSNLTDISYMFQDCESLRELNISGWDLAKADNVNTDYNMFYGCTSLQTIYAYNCNERTIGIINDELSHRGLTGQVTIIT